MKAIGYISTTVIFMVLSSLWNGYALSILWRWFMVPSLGLPPLSIGYAIGLSLVVGYLTQNTKPSKKDDRQYAEILIEGTVTAALKPAFALLFGFVVTAFL